MLSAENRQVSGYGVLSRGHPSVEVAVILPRYTVSIARTGFIVCIS